MTSLVGLALLPCTLLTADTANYHAALREAQANKRPLVVLVGADWCPGCVTMKQRVLPSLVRRGALRNVSLATVDADRERDLANQLMNGNTLPQLIVFSQGSSGQWQRQQITGPTSEAGVQSLIAQAIERPAEASPSQSVNSSGVGGGQ